MIQFQTVWQDYPFDLIVAWLLWEQQLSELRHSTQERTQVWHCKPGQKPIAWKSIGPAGNLLLPFCCVTWIVELPSKHLLYSQIGRALTLGQRSFFLLWVAVAIVNHTQPYHGWGGASEGRSERSQELKNGKDCWLLDTTCPLHSRQELWWPV